MSIATLICVHDIVVPQKSTVKLDTESRRDDVPTSSPAKGESMGGGRGARKVSREVPPGNKKTVKSVVRLGVICWHWQVMVQ